MTKEPAPYHHDPYGGFRNPPGSPEREAGVGDMTAFLFKQLTSVTAPKVPESHVVGPGDMRTQITEAGNPSITWLGHASFIIRAGGRTILTDPFLGERAGPAGMGPRRFVAAPLTPEELPAADVMVVSHNHYDHLDAVTIDNYPFKASVQVVVPLGLGPFFATRGYTNVVERDWWQFVRVENLKVTALPAVHFSGRGVADRNETLWASFALEVGSTKIWFAGDTGRGTVFDEIGKRKGPFDLALVPIGAYEPRKIMEPVHTNPEEAVQIARQVRARQAIGMHWGTIMLTPEDPFEAPLRFRQAAKDQGFGMDNAWVMKIGETRRIPKATRRTENLQNEQRTARQRPDRTDNQDEAVTPL